VAELKTRQNERSVEEFLEGVTDEQRRRDCLSVLEIMKRVTRTEPSMWGSSIVGFGKYHYKYESGREGDWFLTGFSPRKKSLTLYFMAGFDQYEELMGKLGKHKTGKSCLYINKLEDVDSSILEELIRRSVDHVTKTHA
jgi:hypothetical protein